MILPRLINILVQLDFNLHEGFTEKSYWNISKRPRGEKVK